MTQPPVTLVGSHSYRLTSHCMDQALQLDISLPVNYNESQQYPVVYLTDGNGFTPTLAAPVQMLSLSNEIPEVILVGIGYPIETAGPDSLRTILDKRVHELTPSVDKGWPERSAKRIQDDSNTSKFPPPKHIVMGGADTFLDAIEQEVKPLINRHYATDSQTDILCGHSLGGLFTLYTLLTRPQSFSHYVAGSPSLWWHNEMLFEVEQAYASQQQDLAKTVFISVGELEEPIAAAPDARMVSNMQKMVALLQSRDYPSLQLSSVVLADETHISSGAVSLIRGLRTVLADNKTEDSAR